MSLLITGGAGFIGSNFVTRRRQQHPAERLIVLDALTYAGNLESLAGVTGFEFVHGDICDRALLEQTLRDHAVDEIVHFAAESHVDRSILAPGAFVQTNVVGTATLLDVARAAKVKRFVFVSTDEVYGDMGDAPPATERTPLAPRSPYSASKAGAEHLVHAYFETYGFPTLITRCSNNYGPYQFPEKLIPLMILTAMEGKSLPVYGDGQNVRDWIHVEDHCIAIDRVLEAGRDGEVYNIGGRSERKNLDVVKAILAATGKPESLITFVADRLGHDRRYAIDDEKLERELGVRATRVFEDGLKETVAWYVANARWSEHVRSGAYLDYYAQNYGNRADAKDPAK
ncbi:dTDP-glucose 4,6-dehydratase [soil metagenome]